MTDNTWKEQVEGRLGAVGVTVDTNEITMIHVKPYAGEWIRGNSYRLSLWDALRMFTTFTEGQIGIYETALAELRPILKEAKALLEEGESEHLAQAKTKRKRRQK